MPSLYEPFGVAPLEAMVYELPCVLTNRWALKEMVTPGENGDLVECGSAHDIEAKLATLLGDPAGLQRMGEAGRERVLNYYTWPRAIDRCDQAAMSRHESLYSFTQVASMILVRFHLSTFGGSIVHTHKVAAFQIPSLPRLTKRDRCIRPLPSVPAGRRRRGMPLRWRQTRNPHEPAQGPPRRFALAARHCSKRHS